MSEIIACNEDFLIENTDMSRYLDLHILPQKFYLILCLKGSAVFSFNHNRKVVKASDLLIILSDLRFSIIKSSIDFCVLNVEISKTLSTDIILPFSPDFITSLYYNPIIKLDHNVEDMKKAWMSQFLWSIRSTANYARVRILKNNLQNLLQTIEAIHPYEQLNDIKPLSSKNRIFNDFCNLISERYNIYHKVKYYADILCITPFYLSKITMQMTQATPKQMIDSQLISGIKHELQSTEMSIKEISTIYHFSEPSYLSKFFKKNVGMTPIEYREENSNYYSDDF